jgi:lipoprotein-anchoring transpeptidase ErfK/SrfK
MNSETVGIDKSSPDYYDLSNVQYAMRETDSGEFVHAAPWSVGSQGRANVSHGCIGVSTSNGSWLFANCKVGDLINVTGTSRGLEKGNGWTDWNVSYDEFRKDSAL